jgi:VCBS repeat-containing protein
MRKKSVNGRRERHASNTGICFEALEPRLLLSGSWGAAVDGPSPNTQANTPNDFNQDTVALYDATGSTATDTQLQSPQVDVGFIDLLADAPALNLFNENDATANAAAVPDAPTTLQPTAATLAEPSANDLNASQPDMTNAVRGRELVLVNANVTDYEKLIADLQANDDNRIFEVMVLEADRDGIEQVSEILAERSDLAAVHFITHGSDGQINLGSTSLNSATLQQNSAAVSEWGHALIETGDFLFYGCNIAADSTGQSLLNNIADLTGADVAASTDVTGHAALGGDWDLEHVSGTLDTGVAIHAESQSTWGHLLVDTDGDGVDDASDLDDDNDGILDTEENAHVSLAANETNAEGLAFNNDGSKMFVVGDGTDNITQYTLTTNWDVTGGLTYDGQFNVNSQDNLPRGITFSSDGLQLFIAGDSDNVIDYYDLTTAFDITAGVTHSGSFDCSSQETGPKGITFSTDGLQMFIAGTEAGSVNQYTLSSPFDLSGGVAHDGSYSVAAQETAPEGIRFSNDGLRMFVVGSGSDTLHAYDLGTAFDVTGTVTYDTNYSFVSGVSNPRDLALNSDGSKFYVVSETTDAVHQYGLSGGGIDTDGDGTIDSLDLDSDDDGIPDNVEAQSTAGYVAPNGTFDANGVDTAYSGGLTPVDTDGNGAADFLDTDSDDDGYSDFLEGGQHVTVAPTYADPNGSVVDPSTDFPDSFGAAEVDYRESGYITQITGTNFSFELPATILQLNWTNVPGWSSTGLTALSGVEQASPTDGAWNGYVGAGLLEPSVWQLTDHTIVAGQIYELKVDSNNSTTLLAGQLTMRLYYDNAGSKTEIVSLTTNVTQNVWNEYTLSFSSDDMPAAIGQKLGVEFDNTGGTLGKVRLDNVRLSYTSMNIAPTTDTVVASGNLNDASIAITLTGSDIDGTVASFQLNDLPANGTLYSDAGLSTVVTTGADYAATGETLTLYFVPNTDWTGTTTFDYVAKDDDGLLDATAATATINVNDAPLATNLSAAESYTEDTALNLTDIVVSDVDSSNVTVSFTLSDLAAGSLNTATSGSVTSTFATGVWTASGAIADVNTLLAGLTYTPALNYNSNFSIATSVDDGVAAAITGSKAMTATAVNDAPLATNLSAAESYTEDTALNLTDIVVSDVDSATVTVTLTLSDSAAGSLNTATSGSVTSTFAAGVWTASGAIADVNTLLAGLTFTPSLNYNSDFTIATSVDDGVAAAITGNKVMTGTAVNDAPSGGNITVSATEDTDYTFTLADFGFSDVEGNSFQRVWITTLPAQGTLKHLGAGFAAGNYVWTTDIDSGWLTYTPPADANGSGYTDFTFEVQDDGGTANGGIDRDSTANILTIDIAPVNDTPVVSGTFTGAVTEGNIGDAAVTATGTISISDVDTGDSPSFADVASTAGDNAYGSFVLSSGTWTYTLDQSAVQDLDASDTVTDVHTYTATDGTTQQITVTITGTNDTAVVSGTTTGAVTEGNVGDAAVTATGTISINDADTNDSPSFADVGTTAGDNAFGSFVLSSGTWTYTLDQSAVQDLDAGDTVNDTHTYTATDGTTQVVTITITGTNDTAVVSGTTTGAVTEGNVGDAAVTAAGVISISDVDADDSPSFADVASTAGDNAYGSFVLSSGTWTYTLDQSAVQDLDAGDIVTDTHTYTATDGTTQVVTITITGTADAAMVSGTTIGAVTEGNVGDAAVTAAGTISINDLDADDNPSFADVGSTAGDNAYGSFVLSSGTWTYTLDQSAVQDLDAGDTVTDTHTYTATDGTTQQITITITGTDDTAVVSGTTTGAVTEGNVGDAAVTATGSISISDTDADDSPSFADVGATAGDNAYGSFVLSSGTWTYTLDQSAVQDLDAGDIVTDTHTYTATDGTTQQITITITGTNDTAVVSGTTTGAVTEGNIGDAAVTATGTISINDADADDSPSFADVGATAGDNAYGSFVLSSGTWTYTLDQSAVQDLDAGDIVTDTHTYTATDGTTQQITITITGTNDAAVVSGTTTGAVTEGNIGDAAVTATGTISINDVDADDNPSFADVASTAGDNAYGSFVLSSGTWTYTLDQSAVQDLDAGDTVTDTHTYTATDGTTQQITITITGSDDAAVISGTTIGNVTEGNVGDAAVTATGTISISDVDADDSPSFADVGATAGDNAYGNFVLSSGTWTYTLDQSAVQDLDAGDTVTDTHTYTATDGTTQQITITIPGTDDAAVVSGTTTGVVTEGNVGDAAVTATGTISISDADADDSPSFADVGATAGDNAYGSFVLSSGTWTYTLDQSAVQDLDAGDTVTDTHTYTATDGTTQQITITITGSADAAVVSGTTTGAVTEGNVGDAAVMATGAIAISDVDADDSPSFTDVAATAGDNAYGSFVLSSGTWTYTLDQSAVQDLDAGDTVTDTITYTATEGSTQQITVAITGTVDAAVVSGTTTGAVTEGNAGDAAVTATGTISISDADADDSPSFADVGATAGDNAFGSFVLSSGTWTYTLDQSAVQDLDAGDTVTDTHTYTATDGTTQQITVTITGTADAAVVSGTTTGSVTEGNVGDAAVTATGTISISDADANDSPSFADVAAAAGDNAYGSFVLSSGTWTYTLDQSAVQDLDAGDTVTDTHTYKATDGTTQVVTITITGTNDAAVVSGTTTGAVTEGNVGDAAVTATGSISISDADANDSPSFSDVGSTAGDNTYGSFVLSSGTWTYTVDQSAVQDLDAGDTVTDTHTYTATDGTTQQITVTITGSDDAAVVSGTTTGAVTEGNIGDAAVTATGTISINDADANDSPSFADVGFTAGDNAFGSFVLSSGTWTFTLDQSAVQDLDAGDTVTDTHTYTATDGTTQVVTITISGTNDAAVVSGTTTGAVNEGNIGDAAVTATGTISINDADADDSPSFADVGSTAGDNAYGSFVLSSGTWTYTLDQSAVQDLDAGDTVTDVHTYTATDGTTQQITVTITGTNDVAVVSGTTTGAVTEGNVGDAAVTATSTISISDVDADDSPSFADVGVTAGDNAYGSFVLSTGTWTFTLDQSAVQDLDAGDTVTDTHTYTATDGTTQQITITITGTNDAAVVSGTTTGAVTEGNVGDAAVTATGTISINDLDADDSPSFADVGVTAGETHTAVLFFPRGPGPTHWTRVQCRIWMPAIRSPIRIPTQRRMERRSRLRLQ